MDDKFIQALHSELSSSYELGTVEEFGKKLASDDIFRKALFEDASKTLDLGDYATFEGQVKKKLSTEFPLPSIENLQKDFQKRQLESGTFSVAPSLSQSNKPTPVEERADKAYEAKGWPSPRKKMQDFEIGVANLKSDIINQRVTPEEAQAKVDELAQNIGILKDAEGFSISGTEIDMYNEEKERAYQQLIKEKKEGEQEGFMKDVLDQLNIGANRVMTSPVRAMAVSERIANGMIGLIDRKDKLNSTYYQDMAASNASISDMWRESNMRYDSSITELVQRGEMGKAVGQTVMAIAENIPQLATIALGTVSGATNLTLGYVGFDKGADEYLRSTSDPNIKEFSRWVNFATKALSEVVWENIGTVSIIKGVQKGIAEVGEQAMRQQLNSAFTPYMQKQLTLLNKGVSAMGREAGSEMATQITDNLMDMALGRDVKLLDGVGDAGIVGGIIGGGIVSPQVIAEYKGGQNALVREIKNNIPENLDYEKKVELAELLAESVQIKHDQKAGIAGVDDIKKQRLAEIKAKVAEILGVPTEEAAPDIAPISKGKTESGTQVSPEGDTPTPTSYIEPTEVRKEGDIIPVKRTSETRTLSHTKGVFMDDAGVLYKSIEGKVGETMEHEVISQNSDLSVMPTVGNVVNTSEGRAFEIERLSPLEEEDNITLDEYRAIVADAKKLDDRNVFVSESPDLARDKNGAVKLLDFSMSRNKAKAEKGDTNYSSEAK